MGKNEITPECPYCHQRLAKAPARKTKCPYCGQFMYVRTRPKDRKRVLVTKEEADKIDEEWPIIAGVSTHNDHFIEKDELEAERKILRKKFGTEPSENDVKWGVFNKQLLKHARNSDWGLYRNTRVGMGELLWEEMKWKEALRTYLEVCFLDLNGPNNTGGLDDSELLKEFPPFEPKTALLASGIIDRIKRIARLLDLRISEIKQLFTDHNEQFWYSLKLPLSPIDCWNKLEKELIS